MTPNARVIFPQLWENAPSLNVDDNTALDVVIRFMPSLLPSNFNQELKKAIGDLPDSFQKGRGDKDAKEKFRAAFEKYVVASSAPENAMHRIRAPRRVSELRKSLLRPHQNIGLLFIIRCLSKAFSRNS